MPRGKLLHFSNRGHLFESNFERENPYKIANKASSFCELNAIDPFLDGESKFQIVNNLFVLQLCIECCVVCTLINVPDTCWVGVSAMQHGLVLNHPLGLWLSSSLCG